MTRVESMDLFYVIFGVDSPHVDGSEMLKGYDSNLQVCWDDSLSSFVNFRWCVFGHDVQ